MKKVTKQQLNELIRRFASGHKITLSNNPIDNARRYNYLLHTNRHTYRKDNLFDYIIFWGYKNNIGFVNPPEIEEENQLVYIIQYIDKHNEKVKEYNKVLRAHKHLQKIESELNKQGGQHSKLNHYAKHKTYQSRGKR